jgi:hypothetical protein
MAVSIEGYLKKDFQGAIIVIDRLEQERAQLLALQKKVSDAERAARLFSAHRRQRTLGSAPVRPKHQAPRRLRREP